MNPWRICAARVIVVGLSVCLSVCLLLLQLPPRMAIWHENNITYQADSEDQFNWTVFSKNAALRRSSGGALVSYTSTWPFFSTAKVGRMRNYIQSEGISQSGLTVMFAEPQGNTQQQYLHCSLHLIIMTL